MSFKNLSENIELKISYLTLGGPGSGKVGQCESYLSEHPGYVHTNANALFLMNQDQKSTTMFAFKYDLWVSHIIQYK